MADMGKTGGTIGAVIAFIIGLSQGVSDLLQLMVYSMVGGGIGALLLSMILGFGSKKNPALKKSSSRKVIPNKHEEKVKTQKDATSGDSQAKTDGKTIKDKCWICGNSMESSAEIGQIQLCPECETRNKVPEFIKQPENDAATCHYCKKNDSDDSSAFLVKVSATMFGENDLPPMPVGDSYHKFSATVQEASRSVDRHFKLNGYVSVPRCKKCYRIHKTIMWFTTVILAIAWGAFFWNITENTDFSNEEALKFTFIVLVFGPIVTMCLYNSIKFMLEILLGRKRSREENAQHYSMVKKFTNNKVWHSMFDKAETK